MFLYACTHSHIQSTNWHSCLCNSMSHLLRMPGARSMKQPQCMNTNTHTHTHTHHIYIPNTCAARTDTHNTFSHTHTHMDTFATACHISCTGQGLVLQPGVLYIIRGAPGRRPNTACRASQTSWRRASPQTSHHQSRNDAAAHISAGRGGADADSDTFVGDARDGDAHGRHAGGSRGEGHVHTDSAHGMYHDDVGLRAHPSVVHTGGLRSPVGSRRGDARSIKLTSTKVQHVHDTVSSSSQLRRQQGDSSVCGDLGLHWEHAEYEFRVPSFHSKHPRNGSCSSGQKEGNGSCSDGQIEYITGQMRNINGDHVCTVPDSASANTIVHVRLRFGHGHEAATSECATSDSDSGSRCKSRSKAHSDASPSPSAFSRYHSTVSEWAAILILPGDAGQHAPREIQMPWMARQDWGMQALAPPDVHLGVPSGLRVCLFCACEALPGWLNLDVQGALVVPCACVCVCVCVCVFVYLKIKTKTKTI
jgi:hypothetical protein